MTNKFTQEDCTKSIAEIEVVLTRLQNASRAPVLDGTPFLVVIPSEGWSMHHWLVLGAPYDDQAQSQPWVFRMQRGFDLCGALCSSEESAKQKVAKLALREPSKQFAVLHRRDWETSLRDGLLEAINEFKKLYPTLPAR